MKNSDLSPTMIELLNFIKSHGDQIERFPGGFWTVHPYGSQRTWGTKSVQALVDRGVLKFIYWKESRGGDFPIIACLSELCDCQDPQHGFMSNGCSIHGIERS